MLSEVAHRVLGGEFRGEVRVREAAHRVERELQVVVHVLVGDVDVEVLALLDDGLVEQRIEHRIHFVLDVLDQERLAKPLLRHYSKREAPAQTSATEFSGACGELSPISLTSILPVETSLRADMLLRAYMLREHGYIKFLSCVCVYP